MAGPGALSTLTMTNRPSPNAGRPGNIIIPSTRAHATSTIDSSSLPQKTQPISKWRKSPLPGSKTGSNGIPDLTNYSRTLDLATATHVTTWKHQGVTYTREAFASKPDQAIVIRITADQPGKVTGSVRLAGGHDETITRPPAKPVSPAPSATACATPPASRSSPMAGKPLIPAMESPSPATPQPSF